jgi:hypothetical protein
VVLEIDLPPPQRHKLATPETRERRRLVEHGVLLVPGSTGIQLDGRELVLELLVMAPLGRDRRERPDFIGRVELKARRVVGLAQLADSRSRVLMQAVVLAGVLEDGVQHGVYPLALRRETPFLLTSSLRQLSIRGAEINSTRSSPNTGRRWHFSTER